MPGAGDNSFYLHGSVIVNFCNIRINLYLLICSLPEEINFGEFVIKFRIFAKTINAHQEEADLSGRQAIDFQADFFLTLET